MMHLLYYCWQWNLILTHFVIDFIHLICFLFFFTSAKEVLPYVFFSQQDCGKWPLKRRERIVDKCWWNYWMDDLCEWQQLLRLFWWWSGSWCESKKFIKEIFTSVGYDNCKGFVGSAVLAGVCSVQMLLVLSMCVCVWGNKNFKLMMDLFR